VEEVVEEVVEVGVDALLGEGVLEAVREAESVGEVEPQLVREGVVVKERGGVAVEEFEARGVSVGEEETVPSRFVVGEGEKESPPPGGEGVEAVDDVSDVLRETDRVEEMEGVWVRVGPLPP